MNWIKIEGIELIDKGWLIDFNDKINTVYV